MKILLRWIFLLALVMVNVAFAQSVTDAAQATVPANDWTQWNLFGINAVILIRGLGEIYSALKNGGGLVGVCRTIFYGQNVPKAIAFDYHEELKPGAPLPSILKDLTSKASGQIDQSP